MEFLNSQKNVFISVALALVIFGGIMVSRNFEQTEAPIPVVTIEDEVGKMALAYSTAQAAYQKELGEYSVNPSDIGAMLTDDQTRVLMVMQKSDIPEWAIDRLPSDAIPRLGKNGYKILLLNQEEQNQFWVTDQSGEIILTGDLN